jgi:predicted dehydrogenase
MTQAAGSISPLGLGIVGCGSVARGYLDTIRRLQAEQKARPVACCDAVAARAEEYAAHYGVPRVVADLEALLALDEVQAVLIFTPNRYHASMASAALAAGKHVLLEKPMATTLADARALAEQACRSPGHLVCAPFVILSPTFQIIQQRIARGDIGPIYAARARYGWAGPDWAEWFYQPGGGALFDLGVYDLTALTGLLGPAKRVVAMAGICVPEREVAGKRIAVEAPDNIQLILDFGDCVFASLITGFTIQRQRGAELEVYGGEGVIQMLGHAWTPDGYELWQNSAGCWQVFYETRPDWPWTDGLNHLVDCVLAGTTPLTTPEHALHVTEIMIRALESGQTGKAVDLETTFTPVLFGETKRLRPPHRVHDPTRREEDEMHLPGAE